jgi:hypothetical protein
MGRFDSSRVETASTDSPTVLFGGVESQEMGSRDVLIYRPEGAAIGLLNTSAFERSRWRGGRYA